MALVGVEHLGRGGAGEPGERADRAHAADAEQHLLAQPVLGVAAVQPVGDGADDLAVLLHVGVEQQQRHAADLGDPDAGGQRLVAGQPDLDLGDRAVLLAQQRERQAVGVEHRVGLLLPAVAGQRLAEVAVPVEQADADDRHAEVAGGLEVVAGQDAEAAGVLRQHRGDAELRGEVADRRAAAPVSRATSLRWYQRSPVRYCSRSARAAASRRRKSWSAPARRAGARARRPGTGPGRGRRTSHAAASTDAKRSCVSGCQDQRRLPASSPSACERLGQDGTDGEPADCSHAEHRNADRLERSNSYCRVVSDPPGPADEAAGFGGVPSTVCSGPWSDESPSWTSPLSSKAAAIPRRPPSASRSPSAPSIFREGHDELNADVVVTGPDGERPAAGADDARTPPSRTSGTPTFTPDEVGPWTFDDRGLERPGRHLAAQRRDQDPGRHRRRPDVHRGRAAARAAGRRPAAAARRTSARPSTDARHRGPRHRAARAGPLRRGRLPRDRRGCWPSTRCATWSPPRAPTRSSPTGERALFSCLVRVLPALRGRLRRPDDRQGRAPARSRTATERLDAVAEMGFDIIYLPPIHPIGRLNRKGRNNTLDPAPDDAGSPWAIGVGGGRPRRHPPRPRHVRGLRRVRRPRHRARPRGRARPGAAGGARPPLGEGAPRVVHHPRRRHHRLRREPAEEVPGHLPDQLRQRPRRASTPRCCGSCSCGCRTACAIFRVDNPHTKPRRVLGVAARRGPQDRPGRALPRRGVHQAGDDARRSARSASTSPTCYFTWRNAKWEIEEYFTEVAHETATCCARTSGSTPPTSCRSSCSTAARTRSRSGPSSRRPASPSWGVYAGFELFEHVALQPGSEEYLDSEKFQIRVRDWEAAERRRAHARALPHPAQRDPPRAPRAPAAAQPDRALQRRRRHVIVFSKTARSTGDDTVIVVVNLDPHATRETIVHLDMPALGMDWHDQFVVHDEISGESWTWGERNYVRLDPYHEPAHVLTVRRPHP